MYDAHINAARYWYSQQVSALTGECAETVYDLRKWDLAEIIKDWRDEILTARHWY